MRIRKCACIEYKYKFVYTNTNTIKNKDRNMKVGKVACIKAGFCCMAENPPGTTCSSLQSIGRILIIMMITKMTMSKIMDSSCIIRALPCAIFRRVRDMYARNHCQGFTQVWAQKSDSMMMMVMITIHTPL